MHSGLVANVTSLYVPSSKAILIFLYLNIIDFSKAFSYTNPLNQQLSETSVSFINLYHFVYDEFLYNSWSYRGEINLQNLSSSQSAHMK